MELPLGHFAIDTITGFRGYLTSRSEYISGMIQYGVSPMCDPTKMEIPDGRNIDIATLKLYTDDASNIDLDKPAEFYTKYPPVEAVPAPTTDIKCGYKVKDRITGLEGIVNTVNVFLNGCLYFDVIVTSKNESKDLEPKMYLPMARVEYVGLGLNTQPQKKTLEKPPGGPTTRAPVAR